uniref:C2H2-type domain-containing protein n=1 Tax=Panagrolaimus sp. ES5 TaxID=591445 RepID=A0AC34G039_9BILA
MLEKKKAALVEIEEHVEVDVEGGEDVQIAVDDDEPPLLMPQKMPPPDEVPTTTVQEYVGENGETSYIEVAEGYGDEAYYVEGDLGDVKPEDYIVDPNNVCCGICGEVMPYDTLMAEHLPAMHPEVLADGEPDFEEVSYDVWLKDRMEKSHYGYDEHGYYEMQRHHARAN